MNLNSLSAVDIFAIAFFLFGIGIICTLLYLGYKALVAKIQSFRTHEKYVRETTSQMAEYREQIENLKLKVQALNKE